MLRKAKGMVQHQKILVVLLDICKWVKAKVKDT